MSPNKHSYRLAPLVILTSALLMLAACSKKAEERPQVKVVGGRIGVFITDMLTSRAILDHAPRTASLMGVYVSEYLSETNLNAVKGGLRGIDTQMLLLSRQSDVNDPDFQLLQAFADSLQVDVPDMLNRSLNRQEALDAYSNALTNVAMRANTRFKDLTVALETVKDDVREKNKQRSDAERRLKRAIDDKEFTQAGEIQKELNDKEAVYAEANLKQQQIESVLETFDELLSLFSDRVLAMQRNREALIAGTIVVDTPGIDDLRLIKEGAKRRRGRSGEGYDGVFETLRIEAASGSTVR